MLIPEALKLNKFKLVRIPRNKDYFARYGQSLGSVKQMLGDDVQAPMPMSKTEFIQESMQEFDRMMADVDRNK